VLAFKHIAGFAVVKRLGIPFDQGKILAIVVGVTAGAFLAGTGGNAVGRVKSPVGDEAAGDLRVAFQAFESGLAAKFMAGGTVCSSVQGLMCPRKGARGDLGETRPA